MSDDDIIVYYLDCPFAEKDHAKALGAQFDGSSRRWFVPAHHYPIIHRFNRWRPFGNRVYLDCPYSEKDKAKQAGAKWDPTVKAWYATVQKNKQVPAKFRKWLTDEDEHGSSVSVNPDVAYSAASPTQKKTKAKPAKVKEQATPAASASAAKKRGNANDAATLRITDNMTVSQLQDECRLRGIKGISGKTKDWLLEILGVGSIWQTMSMEQTKNGPAKKKSAPAEKAPPKKKEPTAAGSATKAKATATTTPKKKAAVPTKPPPAKKAKATPAVATQKKAAPPKATDWGSLPQVDSNLTVAQLMHELLHRQPDIKGTSNKSKSWFLEALGEHSIWMTSPDLPKNNIVSKQPRVSTSLTIAQLTHELMSRRSSSATSAGIATKGLSSKSKTDLLKLVGAGSIWTTAPPTETSNSGNTKDSKASANDKTSPPKKKNAAVKKTTAASAKKRPANTKKEAQTKSKTVSSTSKNPTAATSTPSVIMPPTPVHSSTSKSILQSSTPGRAPKENEKRVAPPKAKKEATTKTNKDRFKVVPQVAASSPHIASAAVVPTAAVIPKPVARPSIATHPGNMARLLGKQPSTPKDIKTDKPTKTVNIQPATARSAQPVAVGSSSSAIFSVSNKRPAETMAEPAKKNVKLESSATDRLVPVVTSNMTLPQLKEEMKARQPGLKGYSSKNKGWFLSQLPLGTELQSSAEYRSSRDTEAAKLHTHHSRCHAHPLADACILRAHPSACGDGSHLRREHRGRCDVDHLHICDERPYRSCEQCDWDICHSCFDFESLATEDERNKEWQKRREEERRRGFLFFTRAAPPNSYYSDDDEEDDGEDDDLKKFPDQIRNPPSRNQDINSKLKYTVWKKDVHRKQDATFVEKDFDSSFCTLEEASLRVEYVFYYDNPWGCVKHEMYADDDKELKGGLRYMRSDPDGGGSLTVSVMPSAAFDILEGNWNRSSNDFSSFLNQSTRRSEGLSPPPESSYAKSIRNPTTSNKNQSVKQQFTVWTSCGSYEGPPDKEFNSSYATLEQANKRAEYVFFYKNPWGLTNDEEIPHPETDEVTDQGFRYLECHSDDSQSWTVSVVPSIAFEYINL